MFNWFTGLSLGTWLKIGAVVAVVIVVGGFFARLKIVEVERDHAQKQLVVVQNELKEEKAAHASDVKDWEAQVAFMNKQLLDARIAKNNAVQRNFEMFKVSNTKVNKITEDTRNEAKISIRPTDVVTAPAGLRSVYNHAVEGSGIALGDEGKGATPQGGLSLVGKIETFDAAAFTKVLIDNVNEYNALAVRCDKLIDTVKDLEAIDGTDLGGTKRSTNDDGGNSLDGLVATHIDIASRAVLGPN